MGNAMHLGDDPWRVPGVVSEASAELQGFAWLRHLSAWGGREARDKARDLIARWVNCHGRWSADAWRPDILAERLTNWFTHFVFLSGDEGGPFSETMLESIAAQARHLAGSAGDGPDDWRRFKVAEGLTACGLCLDGNERTLDAGLDLLARSIDTQILPDGGHFQRSPSLQLAVLAHLVSVHETLRSGHVEVPLILQGAIDRMAPLLRTFRHGDGGLALFNDGDEGLPSFIELVLDASGSRGRPLNSAPHSGFQRLNAARTRVLVDAGVAPANGSTANTHAGLLSFELSVGSHRMVVNCGAHAEPTSAWHEAVRATAAHSTLTVNETNALTTRDGGRRHRRPVEVMQRRHQSDGSVFVQLSHDGYSDTFGLVHTRDIYLSARGDDVRGKDALVGSGGRTFTLRFHLHPDVRASVVQDRSAVLLRLPTGRGWRFRAEGGEIGLEESVYLGVPGAIRRTEQVVVSGPLHGRGAVVKWSLRREPPRL